jgi:hypothetical protein
MMIDCSMHAKLPQSSAFLNGSFAITQHDDLPEFPA